MSVMSPMRLMPLELTLLSSLAAQEPGYTFDILPTHADKLVNGWLFNVDIFWRWLGHC